jgi:hypothetical protein
MQLNLPTSVFHPPSWDVPIVYPPPNFITQSGITFGGLHVFWLPNSMEVKNVVSDYLAMENH